MDLGTVKMSGGVSLCVRAVCKLTMQTIWDFQHMNVSYKTRSNAVFPQLLPKRDWHS